MFLFSLGRGGGWWWRSFLLPIGDFCWNVRIDDLYYGFLRCTCSKWLTGNRRSINGRVFNNGDLLVSGKGNRTTKRFLIDKNFYDTFNLKFSVENLLTSKGFTESTRILYVYNNSTNKKKRTIRQKTISLDKVDSWIPLTSFFNNKRGCQRSIRHGRRRCRVLLQRWCPRKGYFLPVPSRFPECRVSS